MKSKLLAIAALFLATHAGLAAGTAVERTFVFAEIGARKLRLDLFLPAKPAPPDGYPLIISIHGGGWLFGNRGKDVFLKDFTARGYAVASIDYRLSGTAKFPAQIEDCRAALRWLIANASRLDLDAKRIGVTGASAGGHLALLLGMASSREFTAGKSAPSGRNPIRAICAFYPPTDLVGIIPEDRRTRGDNLVAHLLGGPIASRLALAREGSPMSHVSATNPPVLLIHGDRDTLVPISQSEILLQALRRAGVPVRLIVYAGKGHAFGPTAGTENEIAAFFDRYLRR